MLIAKTTMETREYMCISCMLFKDMKDYLKELFLEVVDEQCVEISKSFMADIVFLCALSDVTRELVDSLSGTLSR